MSRDIIYGDSSTFCCSGKTIHGDFNIITGNDNTVFGDSNTIAGNVIKVKGDYNEISGNCGELSGDYNTVCGNVERMKGEYNQIMGFIGENAENKGRKTGKSGSKFAFTKNTMVDTKIKKKGRKDSRDRGSVVFQNNTIVGSNVRASGNPGYQAFGENISQAITPKVASFLLPKGGHIRQGSTTYHFAASNERIEFKGGRQVSGPPPVMVDDDVMGRGGNDLVQDERLDTAQLRALGEENYERSADTLSRNILRAIYSVIPIAVPAEVTVQSAREEEKKSNKKRKREPEETILDIPLEKKEEEATNEESACKICYDREVKTLFLRCRHSMCCLTCARELYKNASNEKKLVECPICKEKVSEIIEVFSK